MRNTIKSSRATFVLSILLPVVAIAIARPALAQLEEPGGEVTEGQRFGVGAEAVLAPPFLGSPVLIGTTPVSLSAYPSLALSFDTGKLRIDGLLGLQFVENAATTFELGARAFYVLHKAKTADFSVGGGLALGILAPKAGDTAVRVGIDLASQLRVFIASNVALTGTVGLGFSFGKGNFVFGLAGQLIGALGIIYYF
jgi:hypothetical protein